MNKQPDSTLPEDPTFTAWVPWAERNSIPAIDAPGVYALVHFQETAPQMTDLLSQDLVYLGQTSKTLRARWRQFNKSATTGKRAHSGGRTYFKSFGAGKLPLLYVSAFPVAVSTLPAPGDIERRLLWSYLRRHGTLPACNSSITTQRLPYTGSMTTAKLELQRIIQGLTDEEAEDILDVVLMQIEPETITDEEHAESLRRLAEMKAGDSVSREELRARYRLA